MPVFGRRPSGNDIGVGHVAAGQARGSIAGRVSANGWLYRFGARVGSQSGSTVTYQQALYRASGSTITTREGISENGSVSSIMDWGGNGASATVKPAAPIMVRTGIDYALPILCISGALAHGMDHSGTLLHDRAATSFPASFGATNVRPEGRLSTWADIQNNRAPKKPTGLTPAPGASVVTSPTLGANFRDDDETLPGFALGQADSVKSYRFEVWNASKTSRLRNSGLLASSAGQRTARRVTYAPATLPAGNYVARCTVYDQFDVPSPQAEWTFTINAGGAVTIEIDPAQIVGTQGEWPLTNQTGEAGRVLRILTGWGHSSGYSAIGANLRVKAAGGTVVRDETLITIAVPNGGSRTFTFAVGAGELASWVRLTGGQRYIVEAQFMDSAGGWSQWTSTGQFLVNAAPGVATSLSPASGAFGEPPLLSAVIADLNDAAASLNAVFSIRPAGIGVGVAVPVARRSFANGRHYAQLDVAEMPSYGSYEWRLRAVDPWGRDSDYTTWQSITYAQPPQITITAPGAGAVLTAGTPTITFTVDRSMLRYRIRIWNDATNAPAYEYGADATGTTASHPVAAGVLRNLTSYRYEIEVTGTDGLVGRATRFFSISYPNPPAPAWITVAPTPGPFEASQPAASWSQTTVEWAEPTLANAPAAEFQGYVVRMTAVTTGVETIAAVILSRSERVFVHRTPTSGEVYEYSVGYLVERNQVDTVESTRATAAGGVSLVETVIITLDEDAIGAPLRFWEQREADWITAVEIVPSWTAHPIGFQGATNSTVMTGTFVVMDDEQGSYTARDIVAAARSMAGPKPDDDGRLHPRVISYRDPKGRNEIVMLSAGKETDRHLLSLGEMSLTFHAIAVEIGALIGTAGLEGWS